MPDYVQSVMSVNGTSHCASECILSVRIIFNVGKINATFCVRLFNWGQAKVALL